MIRQIALKIMGLPNTASSKDIKAKYHQLARKRHPDKKGGCTAAFQQLHSAYECLQEKPGPMEPATYSEPDVPVYYYSEEEEELDESYIHSSSEEEDYYEEDLDC